MAIITKEDNEMVVRCINELLGCTYIVRDFPADASRYSFLRSHLEDARERLLPIGFDIESSTDAGVFMLKRSSDFAETPIANMNWRAFRAEQLKVLLVLLIMYSGSISVERTKSTTFGMINENLNAYFPELKVKPRKEVLAFLKKWKLIHFSGKAERLSDDSEVLLLHSLAFCMTEKHLRDKIDEIKPAILGVSDDAVDEESLDFDEGAVFYDEEEAV